MRLASFRHRSLLIPSILLFLLALLLYLPRIAAAQDSPPVQPGFQIITATGPEIDAAPIISAMVSITPTQDALPAYVYAPKPLVPAPVPSIIFVTEAISVDVSTLDSVQAGEWLTYVYRVVNAPVMSPFWRRFAHHEARPLDVARMNEAARLFLGEHDWTAFTSAKADGESRVRNVLDFTVESRWDDRAQGVMIEFRISASGFLRYMVRSIVGTMLEVGRGEKDSDTIQTAIVTGDRDLAGKTAPAQGLTLYRVDYD